MEIELFEDDMTREDIPDIQPKHGARAVIVLEDKVCLIHLTSLDLYTLPGGGIEANESAEVALVREVLEETGYTVQSYKETVTLKEYFHDSIWVHHFFKVEVENGQKTIQLTPEEVAQGHTVVFKPLDEALTLLETHEGKHPYSDNIHQREFLGLIHSL